jgi:23S rRNA pseudouridine2605 synthase
MRINQYVAHASGCSRRRADSLISEQRVRLNGAVAAIGAEVGANDRVTLDGQALALPTYQTIALHKPVGYVTSRRQQGSTPTIYELLPAEFHALKPVGRLDKDSSGLLLLTNDGELAQRLQHPTSGKWKRYKVELDRSLGADDRTKLTAGVTLKDGPSRLQLEGRGKQWTVKLQEGRNRQIRRSFAALGYRVVGLHRTDFGSLGLGKLPASQWRSLTPEELG